MFAFFKLLESSDYLVGVSIAGSGCVESILTSIGWTGQDYFISNKSDFGEALAEAQGVNS